MEPGPRPRQAARLTGMAGLLGALRNLGLLGPGTSGNEMRDSFVADDGLRIPVCVLGQGAPVVLVHGLACSHRHWMPVASRLRRRCRVFAWDARGHGACRLDHAGALTLARLGRDLHQLLDHFEIDRPVLVGHSMGALAVMQYLRDQGTGRVAGVAFVDQSPRIVTDEAWRLGLFGGCSADMLLGLVAGARKNFAEAVLHEIEAAIGPWLRRRLASDAAIGRRLRKWLGGLDTAGLVDLAESLALADFRALMPQLDVPTWVVLGGHSAHYRGVPLGQYYLRAVPHASVMVYERSGHSPHVAEPGRFASDLLRFVDEHL